jgi:UDP-N-acetylmuramoylalanine-D-glutamate ligase
LSVFTDVNSLSVFKENLSGLNITVADLLYAINSNTLADTNTKLDAIELNTFTFNSKIDTLINRPILSNSAPVSFTASTLALLNTTIQTYFTANPTRKFVSITQTQNSTTTFNAILITSTV